MRIAPTTDRLAAAFDAAGHQLFLVGGPVRDALLGRLPPDLDFATDARPDEVVDLVGTLGPTWTTGIDFGTVGVLIGDDAGEHRCEITPSRSKSYAPGGRRLRVSYGNTIEGDLSRRDFTVNAMAIRLPLQAARPVVDPFGGLDDL